MKKTTIELDAHMVDSIVFQELVGLLEFYKEHPLYLPDLAFVYNVTEVAKYYADGDSTQKHHVDKLSKEVLVSFHQSQGDNK